MIIVTGSVVARPGRFDELRAAGLAHVHRSRGEPGCISHDIHVDCEHPWRLFFFERWRDMDALRVHFRQPGSAEIMAAIGRLSEKSEGPTLYESTPAG